jgi:hypothetical protein
MSQISRYQKTSPFQPDSNETLSFFGLRPREIPDATPVLEHTLKSTDRLDSLALQYYNDPRKWWRILDANPEILCGADISDPSLLGRVILIPAAEEQRDH